MQSHATTAGVSSLNLDGDCIRLIRVAVLQGRAVIGLRLRSVLFGIPLLVLVVLNAGCGGSDEAAAPPATAQPAAYLVDGVEYGFDYELDAQGRVASYRVSRKPGTSYPTSDITDPNVKECTGGLHGTYQCSSNFATMRGEQGQLVETRNGFDSTAYTYGTAGLQSFTRRWTRSTAHTAGATTQRLVYAATGRLTQVLDETRTDAPGLCIVSSSSAGVITLDAQGRLARLDWTSAPPLSGASACIVLNGGPQQSEWSYASSGTMELSVDDLIDVWAGQRVRTSTKYAVDARGWLAQRTTEVDSGGSVQRTVDIYSVLYSDALVVEERYTQAEPSQYYAVRAPQIVRYQAGRLPSEPTFVPRALTGTTGADYLGIVSSHHR